MTNPTQQRIAIIAESERFNARAKSLSEQLKLPVLSPGHVDEIETFPVVIWVGTTGLGLKQAGEGSAKPVCVDFVNGSLAYRNRHRSNSKELIVKAVGIKQNQVPSVLDVTAGLGRDAFILAAFGCHVQMLERSAIVYALLQDGLQRAQEDPGIVPILERIQATRVEALEYLNELDQVNRPDVIYMDPMFPGRLKSAKVKKEMQVLQVLLAGDSDDKGLLKVAISKANKRVVVKRPRLASYLDECKPDFSITGKSSRFDVYQTFNKGNNPE